MVEEYIYAKEWFEKSQKLHKKYKSLETLKKHCQRVFKKGYFSFIYDSEEDLIAIKPEYFIEGGKPENHIFYIPVYKLKKTGELEYFDRENKVAELTPILAEHIDREEFIKDVLNKLPPRELSDVYERVIKKKAKIKQQPGCVYLSIGGKRGTPFTLMLRD